MRVLSFSKSVSYIFLCLFLSGFFVVSLRGVAPVLAQESTHKAEEKTQHYQAEIPKNTLHALKILRNRLVLVHGVILQGNWKDSDFEAIHEACYSLESALNFLRKTQKDAQSKALDQLDEALQALHYAAENHLKKELLEVMPRFDAAQKAVLAVF